MFEFVTGYVMGSRQAGKVAGMAASADSFNRGPASKLHDVNDRLDRLIMVVEAVWSLLEESGYTKEQLEERIKVMDQVDGTENGRVLRQRLRCPSCDSVVVEGIGHCQICGTEVGEASPFAGI
jgi:hypothetical protein